MSYYTMFLFVICAICVSLYYRFRYPFVKLLNKIPGPVGVPLFGCFFLIGSIARIEKLNERFQEFGSIFRTWIGPVCIVHIGSAAHAREILSSSINTDRSYYYTFLEPYIGKTLFTFNGEKWHSRRKLLTPALHSLQVNEYIDKMVENCQILIENLEKETRSDKFDIHPYIENCAADIIFESLSEVQLNAQKGSRKNVENFRENADQIIQRIINPFVYLDFFYKFTKSYVKQKMSIAVLHELSTQIIKARFAKNKEPKNIPSRKTEKENEEDRRKPKQFLDILFDQFGENGNNLSLNDIRDEIITFAFAGFDTVTAAMSWTIYLVGHHPEVQDKIQAELDSIFSTEDYPLTAHTLARLKYLNCTLKESMRLYPPVPYIARCLTQPVNLDNFTIPAGVDVLIHIHQIHRSPEDYPNPNEFDPSRFLSEKVDNIKNRHPFAFIPFSAGPRKCIGGKFAQMEATILLALFFKKYVVKSITKIEDMTTVNSLTLQPKHGIFINIKRRS